MLQVHIQLAYRRPNGPLLGIKFFPIYLLPAYLWLGLHLEPFQHLLPLSLELARNRLVVIKVHNCRVETVARESVLDSTHWQSHLEHLEVFLKLRIVFKRGVVITGRSTACLTSEGLFRIKVHNSRI